MYCTHIQISEHTRLDLFTSSMFRFRNSNLSGERFPEKYEIPFAVGHTDPWEPVTYSVTETDLHIVVHTEKLAIYCWKSGSKFLVNDLNGNRLHPSTEPAYGLFRNGCMIFDSAGALLEPTQYSRYCHWFYNPETGLYDHYLGEDLLKDVFFIWAEQYAGVFEQFNRLVGPEPMLSRKSFGFYQTQHIGDAGSQELLMEVARQYRQKGIPCDTIIMDLEWGDGVQEGKNIPWGHSLDWNSKYCSPVSPAQMLQDLQELHFQVMLIHHSIPDYPNQGNEGWIGKIYPHEQWWEAMQARLDEGIVGTWQDTRKNDISNSRIYTELQRRMGDQMRCNLLANYDLYRDCNWTMDSLVDPEYQCIGGRRYPYSWTGDMSYDNWQELRFQVECITNRHGPMKGISYLTNDCMRGFSRALAVRSNQFLCFSTIARSHNGKPWQSAATLSGMAQSMAITNAMNEDAEEKNHLPADGLRLIGLVDQDPLQEEIMRRYLSLRYRLMPYIYTAARENYDTGMPVCRPMMVAFECDCNCNRNQWPAQYMFGPDILVAPVVDDVTEMEIYLPAGCDWYDYWTSQRYEGSQVIRYDVSDLSVLPLFVRAGAIIPMQESCQWMDHEHKLDPLYLDIFPGKQGQCRLYEDDGHSLSYQHNSCSFTSITTQDDDSRLTIIVSPATGTFPGQVQERAIFAFIRSTGEELRFLAPVDKETVVTI